MTRMLLKPLGLRRGRTYFLIALAVGLIGYGIYASLVKLRPLDDECVHLGAGSAVARRFEIAECLASESRTHGLLMEPVATKGFEDSMHQVSEGKLDAALVSSGLQIYGCENVQLLAGLDVAPLHILVRRELVEAGLSLAESVKGRRVNLGSAGTNDREMAEDVLRFLRLHASDDEGEGDYTDLSLSKDELSDLADAILAARGADREARLHELPDVVMSVSSMPSQHIQHLLDTGEYSLMPFPYAEPYLTMELGSAHAKGEGVNRSCIESTKIPTAMYVGKSPIPASDCPTLGMRTLLVARADLPSPVVGHLMQILFETDFAERIEPQGPHEIVTPYAIHAGATDYLERNDPLFTSELFEKLSGVLSIFGAFSAGALSLYGYLRRRRVRRPDEYIQQIRRVDALLTEDETSGGATRSDSLVRELDSQLLKLKEQLIHDYCNKRVEGEMVVLSILSMVADSRAELRRTVRQTGGEAANAGLASIELGGLRVA